MGIIINPRGVGGAGKTELVRRIAALYGWPDSGEIQAGYREGRRHPIYYVLQHPRGGRALAVLGHYEVTSGGCDTLGNMDEVFQLARGHAGGGCDVLFEGLLVSRDHQRSAHLARTHRLHVLRLTTPLDRCVRQLIRRRRACRDLRPQISHRAAAEWSRIEDACNQLRGCAKVEALDFTAALCRARELLGLGEPSEFDGKGSRWPLGATGQGGGWAAAGPEAEVRC